MRPNRFYDDIAGKITAMKTKTHLLAILAALLLVACQGEEQTLKEDMKGNYIGIANHYNQYIEAVAFDTLMLITFDSTYDPTEVFVSMDTDADNPQISLSLLGEKHFVQWNDRIETDTAVIWEFDSSNDYAVATLQVSFFPNEKKLRISDSVHGFTMGFVNIQTFDGKKQ